MLPRLTDAVSLNGNFIGENSIVTVTKFENAQLYVIEQKNNNNE